MNKKYCGKCGGSLIRVPRPAEKLEVATPYDIEILGSRFSPFTGRRQFGIVRMCENYRWWNTGHRYEVNENSLHESDLPELTNL